MRINVDFPQPDGPINAVTVPVAKSIEISSKTCFLPNQACTPLASRPLPPELGLPALTVRADATSPSERVAPDAGVGLLVLVCFPVIWLILSSRLPDSF